MPAATWATPLHVALRGGHVALAEALLDAGARTDLRCEFGDTAAERAAALGGALARALSARRRVR